ncbi:MAG: protein kinase, partial [bacterium]|nr:protein kinase [bacterium]
MAQRFLREGHTLSKLNHPNIVTIYDVGQVEECYYMVMEYFQESLKDQIDTRGKIEPGEALHIV